MTTNTLKEITEAASLLFKKTMNTYTLQDLTRHRAIPHKNLYEICSQYPSQGINFKVWRKAWPQNSYYVVKDIKFKDTRHGKVYGVLYWKGVPKSINPERIRGGLKRGTWRYNVGNSSALLDNGVYYSTDLMNSYKPAHPGPKSSTKKEKNK